MAKTRMSSKFDRCVKSVKKTVRARKGSNKESAAIAICTKTVLHKRGRTLKKYRRGRLITQKKFRGGDKSAAEAIRAKILDPSTRTEDQAVAGQSYSTTVTKVNISDIPNYQAGIDHLIAKIKPGMFTIMKTDTRKEIVEALTEAKRTGNFETMTDDFKNVEAYLKTLTV